MSDFESLTVADVSRLQQLSPAELALLEKQLLDHFETSLRRFFQSRLQRVDYVLRQLDETLVAMGEQERNWLKIYQFETETVAKMLNATENRILRHLPESQHQVDEFEQELEALVRHMKSPLEMDNIIHHNRTLPFQNHFEAVMEPYRKQLAAIGHERDLQTQMIAQTGAGKQTIIWKQYLMRALECRQQMVDETLAELALLHREHYGLDSASKEKQAWDSWHRSAMGVTDIVPPAAGTGTAKANSDDFYGLENRHFPRNKIELTNIRLDINNRKQAFETAQSQYSTEDEQVRLIYGATPLTEHEAELDIGLLRRSIALQQMRSDSERVNSIQKYTGVDNGNDNDNDIDIDDDDDDDNDNNNEIDREERAINSEEASPQPLSQDAYLQSAYREFLRHDIPLLTPALGLFKLPELPPLDSFPPA